MVMGWIFTGMISLSVVYCMLGGRPISAAITEGAQNGINLAISISGSLCLWSGVGKLMEKIGATQALARIMSPMLCRLFPSARDDQKLKGALSANVCANLLGLGNAATPMGIQAARRLVDPNRPGQATGELCRLIVLNTASIQLIPANVAAIRGALGAESPFDILPAVWVTSLLSAGLGVAVAMALERVWRDA